MPPPLLGASYEHGRRGREGDAGRMSTYLPFSINAKLVSSKNPAFLA